MRRYQYRLNDQNVSLASWGDITPLKYMETVPGETWGGTITVKARSALTDKIIHSRAYYDLYAFYCPLRLLWEGFPEFLAGHSGDVEQPTTKTLFPQNFENAFCEASSDSPTTENANLANTSYLRRMYYLTYFSFFAVDRLKDKRNVEFQIGRVRSGEYDRTATLYQASARESTFDESWNNFDEDEGTFIPVETRNNIPMHVNLDGIRRAYALDRFEKMRDFYGSRYTDVLRGYGVKADWGILQEPECIGISNNDWRFVKKSSTGDETYGDEKGYFEGEYRIKLRKTFTPEHGIIGIYAVPRADVFNKDYPGHIMNSRNIKEPTVFYDPVASSAYNSQKFPKRLLSRKADGTAWGETQLWEHLRKGRNEHAIPYGTDWDKLPVFSKSMNNTSLEDPQNWRHEICMPSSAEVRTADVLEDPEAEEKISVDKGTIVHYTEVRCTKRSPVQPGNAHIRR